MAEQFTISTEAFEGPLTLLLELIEKRKLFINDIALAEVADEYVEYINNHDVFPTKDAAQFILVASTLLLIKSKSLLPTLELSDEEERDVEDLERRLRLYKRTRSISRHTRRLLGQRPLFTREHKEDLESIFAPDPSVSLDTLRTAAQRLIQMLPKTEKLPTVVTEKILSLEEAITRLAERVTKNISMRFSEFAQTTADTEGLDGKERNKAEKLSVIVSFLAMLELVKQGTVAVRQNRSFADIEIDTQETSVPTYR